MITGRLSGSYSESYALIDWYCSSVYDFGTGWLTLYLASIPRH